MAGPAEPLTAIVVLAGGEGRRMGGAKPLRRYGSESLLANAVSLARRWSPQVAVAVRSQAQVADETDAPLILDDPSLEGPIAALAGALEFAEALGAARLLTLPCDTPRLPSDLLLRLEAAIGDRLVAVAASGGILQPVCALWRPAAAARLSEYLAGGRRSLRGFAEACGMAVADWPATEAGSFVDADTPEELAALQPRPQAPASVS